MSSARAKSSVGVVILEFAIGAVMGSAFTGYLLDKATVDEARASRDELADDHVLLQAVQRVFRSGDGSTRQHLDGVLEG